MKRKPKSETFNDAENRFIQKELALAARFKGSSLTSDEKRKVKKIAKHQIWLARESAALAAMNGRSAATE